LIAIYSSILIQGCALFSVLPLMSSEACVRMVLCLGVRFWFWWGNGLGF